MTLSASAPAKAQSGAVTKRLMVVSNGSHLELANEIATHLGVSITPLTAHEFANGELFVRFDASVRGGDVFVLQAATGSLNTWLMEQLIMVDALKRASARHITVILPFYPYSRQDKKHRGREPISARLVADLFAVAGAERIMTVDLHTPQTQGFFDGPVDHLLARSLLAGHIRRRYADADVTVVAPDASRVRLAEAWAGLLGERPIAFIRRRDTLYSRHSRTAPVVGDVRGRLCVVVDDMIDTGVTIASATRLLLGAGASGVIAAATHGVLSGDATDRLHASGVREVVLTDTLPIPDGKRFPQLTVLSIAPLLSKAIQQVFDDGSVTSLFDGQA
ncbi:ribose-phosphate diphosphokinase [Kibdelosporangium philippinense]|uniref:ribose-phosphate diphosphokinase n=1 Tax=Kibdelosporangium philippinense TaxID=211113 RepID=A0ABS8ZJ83_9PSEU|nr:ribose-phosphate diphosphokinase [Kibdelosporangium philippinense]MCE7007015.1 ribose-phosphate diphosphokinase [Kibdelosporangium philippinense]